MRTIWLVILISFIQTLAITQSLPTVGGTWIFEGPAPLSDATFGPLGGTITSLVATQNGVLAGTVGGGVWSWQSGSWLPLSDDAPSLEISALARDPNSGAIYAGTGDVTLRDGGLGGVGLLVSSDAATWRLLPGSSYLAGLTITGIWIDGNNSSHLVVGTTAAAANAARAGLYESNDGGANWSLKYSGEVASIGEPLLMAGVGGQVVLAVAGGVLMTYSPVAGARQYLVAGSPAGVIAAEGRDGTGACMAIGISSDETNWNVIPCPSATVDVLVFGPEGSLWAAGDDVWKLVARTWQRAAGGLDAPGPMNALLFTNGNVWAGGAGGARLLTSGGSGWINITGSPGTPALGAVILSTAALGGAGLVGTTAMGRVIAKPGGGVGGLSWNVAAGGATGRLAVAASDPSRIYAAGSALGGNATLLASSDGGMTYQTRSGPSQGAPLIVVEATNPDRLYWATTGLWESVDGGQSWSGPSEAALIGAFSAIALAPQNSTVWYLGTSAGQVLGTAAMSSPAPTCTEITALAIDPDATAATAASAEETVVAGCGGSVGGLYLSTNGAKTWTSIGAGLPGLPVVGAAFDPVDPEIVFVALTRGVFASPDRGGVWYAMGSGLPNAELADLRLVGSNSGPALLAATAGRGAWMLPLPGTSNAIKAVSGGGQTGTVSEALAAPLVASVEDGLGLPRAGVAVSWTDGGAGGTFAPASDVTDANGQATTTYSMPNKAGAVTISAAISGGAVANFGATAVAGVAARLVAEAGGNQSGEAGTQLAQPVVTVVEDASGNPVTGIGVAYTDGGAGGSFSPAAGTSDGQGRTATRYTLPAMAGVVTLTASAAGLPPANYSETATPQPDFVVTLSPGSQNANLLQSVVFQLAVAAPAGGVGPSGPITLRCVAPAGCGVTPGAVSLGGSATVTVSASTIGANTVTVEASNGSLTHDASAMLQVLAPDFGVSLSGGGGQVNEIAANQFTVATTAIHGDFHLIALTCITPVSGCSVAPEQVSPGQGATVTVAPNALAAGQQTVTVRANDGSNTHTASVTVGVVAPGLTLALAPTSATVTAGQTATTTLTITPSGGLSGPVALTCTGLPAKAACNFQPATLTSDGKDAGTVTVSVATTANGVSSPIWPLLLAWILLAGTAMAGLKGIMLRRRRAGLRWALAVALALGAVGCGGSPPRASAAGQQPTPLAGTPAGSYTVNVAGSLGGFSGQALLTMDVR